MRKLLTRKGLGLLCSLLLLLAAPAHATTYYMTHDGNGTDPTTIAGGKSTLQSMIVFLNASGISGDVIRVCGGGTYSETIGTTFSTSLSGDTYTFELYETVGYTGEAIIDFGTIAAYGISRDNTNYTSGTVTWDGLTFKMSTGATSYGMMDLRGKGTWTFQNCNFDFNSVASSYQWRAWGSAKAGNYLTLDTCTWEGVEAFTGTYGTLSVDEIERLSIINNTCSETFPDNFIEFLSGSDVDYLRLHGNTLSVDRSVIELSAGGGSHTLDYFVMTNNTLSGQRMLLLHEPATPTRGIIAGNTFMRVLGDGLAFIGLQLGLDSPPNNYPLGTVQIFGNTFREAATAYETHMILLGFGTPYLKFQDNIVDGRDSCNMAVVVKSYGGVIQRNRIIGIWPLLLKGARYCDVSFNTLYDTRTTSVGQCFRFGDQDGTYTNIGNQVHSNIFVEAGVDGAGSAACSWDEWNDVFADYNLYYNPNPHANAGIAVWDLDGTPDYDKTLAEVQAAWPVKEAYDRGHFNDLNSVAGNPLLVNVTSSTAFADLDFSVRGSSPALGIGVGGSNAGWYQTGGGGTGETGIHFHNP